MPKDTSLNKILVIGSGPIIIGQAAEFDYAGTQACKALRKKGQSSFGQFQSGYYYDGYGDGG